MQRREVYATTGPRMTVRFFGGWDFSASDASYNKLAPLGYAQGVPMGSVLNAPVAGVKSAPTFLLGALKDPLSGHLDRLQIIKGWTDAKGVTHEKIFDVSWSDSQTRQPDSSGRIPAVGSTVDVENASWANSIGAAELVGYWQDPEFDATQPAVYYARVIEIPTPRWTTFDTKYLGDKPMSELQDKISMTIQERAYTSPIWYTPTPQNLP